MNNQQYRQQELEINLKEVIWDLLEQWKAILIAAILMALLVSGAKHYKDISGFRADIDFKEAQTELTYETMEEHVEAILSELSDDDHSLVQLVLQQEAWLDNQTEYFNNSLLLGLDPNAQRQLTISYYLYDASDNAYNALCDAYISNLKEETFANAISKQLQLTAEKKYVKELIRGYYTPNYTNDSAGNLLNVVITLPDNSDAVELEKEISELMNEYSKELSQKIAEHKIKLIKMDDTISVNENAASKRTSTINSINSLNTSIANNKKAMNDTQKSSYDAIVALKESEGNDNTQADEEPDTLTKPSFSKKYAVLGLLLGAMAYAFSYLIIIILRGRVNAVSDLENYTNSRMLGEIYEERNRRGFELLLSSKFVEGLRYKGLADNCMQMSKARDIISAICKHSKIKEFATINLTNSDLEQLNERIQPEETKITPYDASELKEEELVNIKNAVLIAGKETKIADLARLASLCNEYDVNIMGNLFVGRL